MQYVYKCQRHLLMAFQVYRKGTSTNNKLNKHSVNYVFYLSPIMTHTICLNYI